jgi:hypothetical protein
MIGRASAENDEAQREHTAANKQAAVSHHLTCHREGCGRNGGRPGFGLSGTGFRFAGNLRGGASGGRCLGLAGPRLRFAGYLRVDGPRDYLKAGSNHTAGSGRGTCSDHRVGPRHGSGETPGDVRSAGWEGRESGPAEADSDYPASPPTGSGEVDELPMYRLGW